MWLRGLLVQPDMDVAQPLIGFGVVRHTRLRPAAHAFAYPTYFLMLPMRGLRALGSARLALNRFAPISFFDCDHGDGRGPQAGGALGWLDAELARNGICDADGEVWLHCYPRVWGFTFKPVSFWYCHRAAGSLRAIFVEVNNTFGERHCYLLDDPHLGTELRADKVLHVSPFAAVAGGYRFRFMVTPGRERTVARVDWHDADGPVLQTSVSGHLEPVSTRSLRRAAWGYPLMTLALVGRIHWQALQLWRKRVPFFHKPAAPSQFMTR